MTKSDDLPSTTFAPTTTVAVNTTRDDDSSLQPVDDRGRPSLTDTLAAVTIAVLAVVLVITLTLIVRAIQRRRQLERGQELNYIPTVSAGIISANVAAYRNSEAARSDQPVISWESVGPSTSTSTADFVA